MESSCFVQNLSPELEDDRVANAEGEVGHDCVPSIN